MPLTPALLDRFWSNTSPEEGLIPFMYLDSLKSLVTAGPGIMLPSAAAAQALTWDKPSPVVTADFARVRAQAPNDRGWAAQHYAQFSSCRLAPAFMRQAFDTRCRTICHVLEGYFPDLYDYPEGALVAMVDLAYNVGVGALCTGWPGFKSAVRARDWARAAKESHRGPPVSAARNARTAALLLSALPRASD
jgi:hypothetical protein